MAAVTQQSMADVCGVSRRTVQKWEAGDVIPRVDECQAYADACGVALAELTEGVAW
jgi:DNA-binding XRE family transcriptional regulator